MATQKSFLTSSLLILLVTIATIADLTKAGDQCISQQQDLCTSQKEDLSCAGQKTQNCPAVLARDAITLSIKEIKDTMDYVKSIPKLQSVGAVETPEVNNCVTALLVGLTQERQALQGLQKLNSTKLVSDAMVVKNMVKGSLQLRHMCQHALKDVDHTISAVLKRKLLDIKITVDNVVTRMKQLKNLKD